MTNPAAPWKGSPTQDEVPTHLMKIPFRHFALVTVSLPLLGFLFCVLWSLWFDFERSTATHCRVTNYLPSISAAIGDYTPQRYVWRVCIGLHAAPRFFVAVMYVNHYQKILVEERIWQRVAVFLGVLHAVENSSLVGLTYVSSSEDYPVHEKCFVMFVVSALTYMFLSCMVPRIASKVTPSASDLRILHLKSFLALTNLAGTASAGYFFIRHNRFCEPGIYTMFAICEYVVVLSNMAFHMCAFMDFRELVFSIGGVSIHAKKIKYHEIHTL